MSAQTNYLGGMSPGFGAYADDSRRSKRKAFCGVCMCVCVCVYVCVLPRDKTKTVESIITKLASWIVHSQVLSLSPRPPINIRSKDQRSRSQAHKVQKP